MAKLPLNEQLPGLRVDVTIGEIIDVNNGELVIQIIEMGGGHVKMVFCGDRKKYQVVGPHFKKYKRSDEPQLEMDL